MYDDDMIAFQEDIIELLESDSFSVALLELDKYVNLFGKDSFYYLAASDAYTGMEEYQTSISLMQEAVEAGLENMLIYERYAEACIGLEQYEEALRWLEKAKPEQDEDSPEMIQLFFLQGRACLGVGEYEKAAESFENILLDMEDGPSRLFAGIAYVQMEDPDKKERGIEYFERLKNDPDMLMDICEALAISGDYDHLLEFLEYLPPEKAADKEILLAEFWDGRNNFEETCQHFINAADILQDPVYYQSVAYFASNVAFQNLADSMHERTIALELKPVQAKEADVQARLHALSALKKPAEECQAYMEKILELYPNSCSILEIVCEYAIQMDRGEFALALLQDPDRPQPEPARKQHHAELLLSALLSTGRYGEAYELTGKYPECTDRRFLKLKAIAALETDEYAAQGLGLAKSLMPDGIIAILLYFFYLTNGMFREADQVMEEMNAIVEASDRGEPTDPVEDLQAFQEFAESLQETIPGKDMEEMMNLLKFIEEASPDDSADSQQ